MASPTGHELAAASSATHPRWRRRLVIAALLLALAAAANYGVAFWLGQQIGWTRGREVFDVPDSTMPRFVRQYLERTQGLPEFAALATQKSDYRVMGRRAIIWRFSEDRPATKDTSIGFAISGWPLCCIRGEVASSFPFLGNPPRPYIPLPAPFAANTALYDAPLLLGWLGLAWVRRRRWGPDACPRCGYSLARLPSATCPECGTEPAQ